MPLSRTSPVQRGAGRCCCYLFLGCKNKPWDLGKYAPPFSPVWDPVVIATRNVAKKLSSGWPQPAGMSMQWSSAGIYNQERRIAMRNNQEGKVGWILLWVLGVPIPVLVVLYFLRGCTWEEALLKKTYWRQSPADCVAKFEHWHNRQFPAEFKQIWKDDSQLSL